MFSGRTSIISSSASTDPTIMSTGASQSHSPVSTPPTLVTSSSSNSPSTRASLDFAALTLGDESTPQQSSEEPQQAPLSPSEQQRPHGSRFPLLVISTSACDGNSTSLGHKANSPPRMSPSEKKEHHLLALGSSSSPSNQIQPQSKETRERLQLCKYKSGRCMNRRVLKRNGDLHTLCEFHRHRQNELQRKSDRKQRAAARQRRLQSLNATTNNASSPSSNVGLSASNVSPCLTPSTVSPVTSPSMISMASPPIITRTPPFSHAKAYAANLTANSLNVQVLNRFKFSLDAIDRSCGAPTTGFPSRMEQREASPVYEDGKSKENEYRFMNLMAPSHHDHFLASKSTGMEHSSSLQQRSFEQPQCSSSNSSNQSSSPVPLPSIYTLLQRNQSMGYIH